MQRIKESGKKTVKHGNDVEQFSPVLFVEEP